jgi:hypothetical protein
MGFLVSFIHATLTVQQPRIRGLLERIVGPFFIQ